MDSCKQTLIRYQKHGVNTKEKLKSTREWNTRETQTERKQELEDIDGTDVEMAVQKMKNGKII